MPWRIYGQILAIPPERILETAEGARVWLAGRGLELFDAPGHARHHVVRELDCGGQQFSFPTTSPSQFDPPALHRSIDRMVSLGPQAIYVTHFGRLRDIRGSRQTCIA